MKNIMKSLFTTWDEISNSGEPAENQIKMCVARGASWLEMAHDTRLTCRGKAFADKRVNDLGFRCARTIKPIGPIRGKNK